MSQWIFTRLAVVGLVLLSITASASARDHDDSDGGDDDGGPISPPTKTVSEAESSARLKGAGTQAAASGYAESEVVTVTTIATKVTTTKSSLEVSVRRLTLANGAKVTFKLNGTEIGKGTVRNGRASLHLSTKPGVVVPVVTKGSTLTVVDPGGASIYLTGAYGAAVTSVESDDGDHDNGNDND